MKKTANQEFYIQQNNPSKNNEEIKTFPGKQKLIECFARQHGLQEIPKGVFEAKHERTLNSNLNLNE